VQRSRTRFDGRGGKEPRHFPAGESSALVDGLILLSDELVETHEPLPRTENTVDLPVLTVAEAPAPAQPILDGLAADLGLIPNFAATIAASPTLLAGFDALRRAVGDPSFDPIRREVAGVAVGVAGDNR
jgi:hypothetical protein